MTSGGDTGQPALSYVVYDRRFMTANATPHGDRPSSLDRGGTANTVLESKEGSAQIVRGALKNSFYRPMGSRHVPYRNFVAKNRDIYALPVQTPEA